MKQLLKFGLILTLLLFVSACAGQQEVNTALEYIQALNAGDIETAQGLVCPAREDEIMNALADVADIAEGRISFNQVSCRLSGGDAVTCQYTIVQEEVEIETPQVREVTFAFEDGLVCGFEEEVAN